VRVKTLLKWTGIGVGAVVGVVVLAIAVLYVKAGSRLHRPYEVRVPAVTVRADSDAVVRGRHLAEAVTLCVGCHGDSLGGAVLVDEPRIAVIYASNLTAGRGGVGATYTDADYVRAIRHGVSPSGRALMIMHSDAYQHLGEEDLGAIISYLRSVPPVDNEVPATSIGLLGRGLLALGMVGGETMPLFPAEVIDHDAPLPSRPEPAVTAEYGRYLVAIGMCRMCHGGDLRGAPPVDEGAPRGPDLAALAAPGAWSERMFVETLRTGVTPYGKQLAEVMPWEAYAKMTDDELAAVWRYLTSLSDERRP
jgi:cytochrome c553